MVTDAQVDVLVQVLRDTPWIPDVNAAFRAGLEAAERAAWSDDMGAVPRDGTSLLGEDETGRQFLMLGDTNPIVHRLIAIGTGPLRPIVRWRLLPEGPR